MRGDWRDCRNDVCALVLISAYHHTYIAYRVYGITVLQTYIYYRRYARDPLALRILVRCPFCSLGDRLIEHLPGWCAVVRMQR